MPGDKGQYRLDKSRAAVKSLWRQIVQVHTYIVQHHRAHAARLTCDRLVEADSVEEMTASGNDSALGSGACAKEWYDGTGVNRLASHLRQHVKVADKYMQGVCLPMQRHPAHAPVAAAIMDAGKAPA